MMFTQEELKNILILVKNGIKNMEPTSDGMLTVGLLLRKIETVLKEPPKEPSVEDAKKK